MSSEIFEYIGPSREKLDGPQMSLYVERCTTGSYWFSLKVANEIAGVAVDGDEAAEWLPSAEARKLALAILSLPPDAIELVEVFDKLREWSAQSPTHWVTVIIGAAGVKVGAGNSKGEIQTGSRSLTAAATVVLDKLAGGEIPNE